MDKIIAIIPARAGSKRLPRKNIIELGCKPMIAWAIESALESGIFSDVLVSTDGEEIAEISRKYGGQVPFLRDTDDAGDHSPIGVTTANALVQMEKYTGVKYDTVIQLMANCPCRTVSDIVGSYENFVTSGTDFQISVFKFGWMNPWWAMKIEEGSMKPEPIFPDALKKRSQDLESLYCPTGAIWIAKADALKREKTFYGTGYKVYPISWQSAVDIDEIEDLEMAEAVFRLRSIIPTPNA